MTDMYVGYRLLLVVCIIAVNAFFAGSEVALLSVRRSRLRQMAEEGHVGAQAALSLLENPEKLLSVVQVGVTISSLGLGWTGESTIYRLLVMAFTPLLTPATEPFLHAISFLVGFLLISYAHVVLGEVVPKNLSLERADRLAALVAPGLLVFARAASPFVYFIERSAAFVSRLLGLRGEAAGGAHSPEELKFLVAASRRHGYLEKFEEEAMERLLDLPELSAREIMVPRHAIVSIPVEASLDQVLDVLGEHQFSRIPVYEKAPEHILGVVYAKDLLEVWHQRRVATEKRKPVPQFHLRRFLRPPLVIPETKALSQLFDEFRAANTHMALVVDEFGTVAGLVTMEDLLEQIVGEIEDEHDVRRAPLPVEWDELELDGTTNIRDLETQYDIEVPTNAGFETLAGFLLYRLGVIPTKGDAVEHGDCRFTVLEMDRNRIARVKVERVENPDRPSA